MNYSVTEVGGQDHVAEAREVTSEGHWQCTSPKDSAAVDFSGIDLLQSYGSYAVPTYAVGLLQSTSQV